MAFSTVAAYVFGTEEDGRRSLCVRAPHDENRRSPVVSRSRRPTGWNVVAL